MLKFVRQGVEDQTDEKEWSSVSVAAMIPGTKDYDDHDCSVCKTRRRSLDRQAAHALRRSRSRETLRSIGNNSNTDEEVCLSEHSKMSQDVNELPVGGGGWATKAGKYRRLSRSCEALSASYKHSHWARGDDSIDQFKSGLLSRILPRKSGKFDGSPSCKDLLTVGNKKEMSSLSQDVKNKQAVTCDCETRKLSTPKTGYSQSLCHDSNTRKSKNPSVGGVGSSAVKQVQFGGVEYQKPKEESVMGRLLNAVSSHRRKLRSRSLERTDRRGKWSREDRTEDQERMASNERTGRPRSKLQVQDKESMNPPSRPQSRDREASNESMSDYEHQQQQRTYKRRSRSRSRERNYRTRADSETRKSERQQYRCHENQDSMDSQMTASRDENCNRIRRRACSDGISRFENGISVHGESYDMQYNTTRLDNACESVPQPGQNNYLQGRGDNSSLISPHYVAPNGHYGKAVVRKCHREQQRSIDTNRPAKNNARVVRLQSAPVSYDGDTAFPSRPNATSGRSGCHGDVHRRSQSRQEKYGVSAQKIANLDSPLKFNSPDLSILENIDSQCISIKQIGDARLINPYKVDGHGDASVSATRRDSPSPLGFVYNCTTARISKLTRPQPAVESAQSDPNLHQSSRETTESIEKLATTGSSTNQCYPPGHSGKLEPANDLVRHASVASLSLISVNSVDSGTSCHEGSTTDSSASSSDKEMEALLRQRHHPLAESSIRAGQRLQTDTRKYTASTREIEHMILASCFGREAHSPARLVTSDYESDTGPDGTKSSGEEDSRSRRKGGASRSVHFAGSKNEMDVAQETRWREQQAKPRGQSISSKRYPTSAEHHTPDRLTGHLDKLTARAHVLHSHKGLSKAEMSIRQGDVVYVTPEDLKQRPLWVVAYSINTGETGLIPSVYLTTNETVRGPSLG